MRPAVERLLLDRTDVTPAEAGSVEETLDADHPVGRELIIAAELSTADDPIGRVPAFVEPFEIGDARLGATPTDVAADVATGPRVDRRSNWRCLHDRCRISAASAGAADNAAIAKLAYRIFSFWILRRVVGLKG